jgi:hypothetical protein
MRDTVSNGIRVGHVNAREPRRDARSTTPSVAVSTRFRTARDRRAGREPEHPLSGAELAEFEGGDRAPDHRRGIELDDGHVEREPGADGQAVLLDRSPPNLLGDDVPRRGRVVLLLTL